MMGRTQADAAGAAWLGGAIALSMNPLQALVGVPVARFFSWGADALDHGGATGSRWLFGRLSYRAVKVLRLVLGSHREGSHSVWILLGLHALLIYHLPDRYDWVSQAAVVGYFVGIACDMVTKDRVAFLWPLSKIKIGIGLIRTGGPAEKAFGWLTRYVAVPTMLVVYVLSLINLSVMDVVTAVS